MTEVRRLDDAEAQNQQSLKKLKRAIAFSQGRFSLILVRCNYTHLREQILEELLSPDAEVHGSTPRRIQTLVLPKSAKTLYSTIQAESSQQPEALMVLGLESVTALDDLLICANQVRDEFRRGFPFPLVLWVNDQVLKKLVKLARDFHSWAGVPIKFAIATAQLIEFLQQASDQLFTKVLEVGADRFVDNAALNLGMGAAKRFELESALKELQNRDRNLPALEASQQFILGRDAYANNQMEQAQQLYEQSLTFWQQNHNLERIACLLLHLGLLWRKYAVLHRTEYKIAIGRARDYYYQCVESLQQATRPDLTARFINALAGVLHELEKWEELEAVVKAAIELHQTYPNSLRLAYAYGFLAEVALAKSQWSQAKQYAQTALEIHAQLPDSGTDPHNQVIHFGWVRQHYRSWYFFLLSQAQRHLGQKLQAFQNLETARTECLHEYNPKLYLRILEELRSLHYQQGKYLEAFNYKQEQLQIQQEYGFRAFIGAGRLQAQRQVIHPTLVGVESSLDSNADSAQLSQAIIAQEIVASGRKQDVERLIERLTRNDQKLIVIHGLSGVGKSSILTAGLVPALRQVTTIDGRIFLSVVVRTYTNWVGELGKALQKSLGIVKDIRLPETPNSLEMIVEQLRKNIDRNLLTVIIFDQFEEFFFNCPKPSDRRSFWDFLHVCLDSLDVPYVKVILSLREDYLHYLLECDRFTNLEITRNDILNKEIRYPFGNFSPEDAIAVIQCLTQRSLYLDPALIEQLVQDLAEDLGEVHPIELQIVGSQLQADKITTLEQYQQYGSKEKLVEEFLEAVIEDCGSKNERAARLVLYLLTDENNTRPPKTRADLVEDLAEEADKLNLVLEIFVKSGLVFVLPQHPADRYQLVHDYLVAFIRQQQNAELLSELTKEKEGRKLAEAQLNQVLKQSLRKTRLIGISFFALSVVAGGLGIKAMGENNAQINALILSSTALFASNNSEDALIEALKAGRKLKRSFGVEPDSKMQVVGALQQAFYSLIFRERQTLKGHNSWVISVSWSPDGKTLASGSKDGTIKLWSRDGKLLQTLRGTTNDGVLSVSWSPDRQAIASGRKDGTIQLWSRDGTPQKILTGHNDGFFSVSWRPDGNTLASGSEGGTIKIWNRDGKFIKTLPGHNAYVRSVSWSPDGNTLASGSGDTSKSKFMDNTIKLWSRDGKLQQILTGHKREVSSVSWSRDGNTLASGSWDNTIKLWSRDGKLQQILTGHNADVNSVSWSPDGNTLASGSWEGIIQLWSRDGKLLQTLKGHKAEVYSVSWSPDGKTLASASWDKTVILWNLDLEKLTSLGCEWLKYYPPETLKELPDCQRK